MHLIRLFRYTSLGSVSRSLTLGVVGALLNVAAFLVHSSRFDGLHEIHAYSAFGISMLFVALFVWIDSLAVAGLSRDFEQALTKLRKKIVSLLVTSEWPVVRDLGRNQLLAVVTEDSAVVVVGTVAICHFLVSGLIVAVGVVALAFESWVACAIFFCFMALCIVARMIVPSMEPVRLAEAAELRLRAAFADITGGPRELALDRGKGAETTTRVEVEANLAAGLRSHNARRRQLSYATVFGLQILAILSVLELLRLGDPRVQLAPWALLLFAVMCGRFARVVNFSEVLTAATRAARRLQVLEAGLRVAPRVPASSSGSAAAFGEIRVVGAQLRLRPRDAADPFVLGPFDLVLKPGTVTFIRGSNGSGKTTLVEILVGLVKPQAGTILLDGVRLSPATLSGYRSLFATVFAHPHLFDRADEGPVHDETLARDWLQRLGLPPEVALDATSTQTAALSTGQRKRLALARVIAEGRPVIVLDEYTADQDPAARARFFADVLPRLKAMGRTVVAVVHGDLVPSAGDRVFQLEDGQVRLEQGLAEA